MTNLPGEESSTALQILLVEDEPAHAELIVRCLEEHPIGTEIQHFTDGEAALDYLLHHGDDGWSRPHVILLDLRLPKIDGLEVLKRIRCVKELDAIPVIVLSTSRDDNDVKTAYSHRANSYLVKPLDFTTLDSLLKDAGFYWLRWNHYPGRTTAGDV